MPRLFSLLLCFFLLWAPNALQGQTPHFSNLPLPHQPISLKILGIGNSFTDDGMEYLPDLLAAAGVGNVTLGKLSLGGCSLQRHCTLYLSGDSAYSYKKSRAGVNRWETVRRKATLKEAVADEKWDIIILQQVSQLAGQYHSYQPWLDRLAEAVLSSCPNAGVRLGWQMTWAYGTASTHAGFAFYGRQQSAMYDSIVNAVQTMIAHTGIDIIVPSATAIQNIRATAVNNPPLDLTRDGFHIDLGAGRYILACTWFQALIAPCLGITVVGNSFQPAAGNVPVTDSNIAACQRAAQYACINRFAPSATEAQSPQ
jgi:hypothetical protein